MKHRASDTFWGMYDHLPKHIKTLAEKNFELLKRDPRHPSLNYKRNGRFWSARVGIKYRVLGIEIEEGILWIWIGGHKEYEKFLK